MMPKPSLRPSLRKDRREIRRIILFGKHPNPTTDYYFAGRLAAPGMPPHEIADIDDADFANLDPAGAFVILCRYASARTNAWIEANIDQLAGVGLLVDDDIPSVITSSQSTPVYKFRLFMRAIWPLRRLNRYLDIIWASTPALASTLSHTQPRILPPAPPEEMWKGRTAVDDRQSRSITIAYHATSIHMEEHRFLAPVIKKVLEARPDAEFEVFANRELRPIWEGMDRVAIRQPLSWHDYCNECLAKRLDIMLVPLAPSPINQSRSSTKRIDVARVGAAGIFSASAAYGLSSDKGEILLPYDANAWEKAILYLADDEVARRRAAEATRMIVEQMTEEAQSGLNLRF